MRVRVVKDCGGLRLVEVTGPAADVVGAVSALVSQPGAEVYVDRVTFAVLGGNASALWRAGDDE